MSAVSFVPHRIVQFFYRNSIFEAADNEAIAKRTAEERTMTVFQKFLLGIIEGAHAFIKSFIIGFSISLITKANFIPKTSMLLNSVIMTNSFRTVVFLGPIYEECLFRGFFQNVFKYYQLDIKREEAKKTNSLKDNHIFKWLTSPSCRILVVNFIFAYTHLSNAGGYLTLAGAITQMALICLYPTNSVLYETTGNFVVPLIAHMTNNFIAGCPEILFKA